MQTLLTAISLCEFAFFAWLIRSYFARGTHTSILMRVLSVTGIVSYATYLQQLWWTMSGTPWQIGGLLLMGAGWVLSLWAVAVTRGQRLYVAFEAKIPERVVSRGPYSLMRHPFYTSYTLFWLGCAVSAVSIPCLAFAIVMVNMYFAAAQDEERLMRSSSIGGDYEDYSRRVGLLWRKFDSTS